MLIKVSDIPPQGMRQEACSDLRISGLALDEPVYADLFWRRIGGRVLVTGTARTRVRTECARCLVPLSLGIQTEFSLEYRREGRPDEDVPDEHELGLGELDVAYFAGDVIDGRDLLREQIILAVPMNPLCREDCKGFCPDCGADLNAGTCACGERRRDSRFSALEKLKEKK